MKMDVLTLFPEFFTGFSSSSMIAKALKIKALTLRFINIRDFASGKHKQADDYPFGGFAGMVMKAEPIYKAVGTALESSNAPVIYFTPHGRPLSQGIIRSYSSEKKLILLCGHYKEIDQRVRDLCVSDEISLGDYVLSGGEIAAMAFIDGVSRLQKGVLSDIDSADTDSFEQMELGFPCWTRPDDFMGIKVPEVLRNGHHQKIEEWVQNQAKTLTQTRRPDLNMKKAR